MLRQGVNNMKIYTNRYHGFEITVPDDWRCPSGWFHRLFRLDRNPIFYCGTDERFNFQIGPLFPEPPLNQTERDFQLFAESHGYLHLSFGRIHVEGKDHLWASYHIPPGNWNKKYMIVLKGTEFAITAASRDRKTFEEKEKIWDNIVNTFRLKS